MKTTTLIFVWLSFLTAWNVYLIAQQRGVDAAQNEVLITHWAAINNKTIEVPLTHL